MRTLLTALVGTVAGALALLAMSLGLAWWTAGTADHLATSVVSILDTPGGAVAMGSALLDSASDTTDGAGQGGLGERSASLAVAAGAALLEARDPLAQLLSTAFTAVADGARVVLDLGPVLRPVLAALHRVDPTIPAVVDGPTTMDLDGSTLGAAATVITIMGLWWLLVLLAIALLAATALASRHRAWRRLRPAGIALAVPALLLALACLATVAVPSDPGNLGLVLFDAALGVVRTKGYAISLVACLLAATLVGLSFIRSQTPASIGAAGQ